MSALTALTLAGARAGLRDKAFSAKELAEARLYFTPWERMRRALDHHDYGAATRHFTQIRWIVATNLALGLITVAISASRRYWGSP